MSKTAYRNVPAVVVNMNMKVKPMFLNAHGLIVKTEERHLGMRLSC